MGFIIDTGVMIAFIIVYVMMALPDPQLKHAIFGCWAWPWYWHGSLHLRASGIEVHAHQLHDFRPPLVSPDGPPVPVVLAARRVDADPWMAPGVRLCDAMHDPKEDFEARAVLAETTDLVSVPKASRPWGTHSMRRSPVV